MLKLGHRFGGPFHMLRDGGDTNDYWVALERFALFVHDCISSYVYVLTSSP